MERVIVVHGLFRVPFQFAPMMRGLRGAGFAPVFHAYASARQGAAESAARFGEFLDRRTDCGSRDIGRGERVHLVGYSLGALVIRAALAVRPDFPAGRFVMIAPPNQGVGLLAPPLPWLVARAGGPALADLREGSSFIRALPPPPPESCIIAGERPHSPLFPSWWLRRRRGGDEPHDGVVDVRCTHAAPIPHATVPETHTSICTSGAVIALVAAFLATGQLAGGEDIEPASASPGPRIL